MARAIWNIGGGSISNDQQISNVSITVTDITNQVEGETVTAVCNGKTFSSVMTKGICKIHSTEVGNYTISAGEYTTMLVCSYFGRFSTDIYSGVLRVVCTEVGGNDKTCQVRSCNGDYNFTDDYSLTQTFDTSMELTFLGIPAGKYLITIDDQYRFFKEITSIQNVNEIEVELKQWLYKDGDQCEWNTGGWIQCKVAKTETTGYLDNTSATGQAAVSLQFLANSVKMNQSLYCGLGYNLSYRCRGGGSTDTNIGTVRAINKLKKYKKIMIVYSGGVLTMTARYGAVNTSTTSVSSGTILVSGSGQEININAPEDNGFIVIGKAYSVAAITNGHGIEALNYTFQSYISQIYLA